MLKLYTAHNSICTQKVFLTLDGKRARWRRNTSICSGTNNIAPEYLKINPKGVVPALDHEGASVIESTLICEYIDGMFPTPSWCRRTLRRSADAALEQAIDEACSKRHGK